MKRRLLRPLRLGHRHRPLPGVEAAPRQAPLYYNEKYDFYALSRYDDVGVARSTGAPYISGKGSVLEIIKSGIEMPRATSVRGFHRRTTCTGRS